MTAPAPPRPILWTVADYDTYAVLHRPDGTAAARFHVIAEAHEACRALNGAMATRALRVEDGSDTLPTLRARNMWGSNVRSTASDEWTVRCSLVETMAAIRRQAGFDTWREAQAAGYDAIPVTVIEGHHSPGALVKDGVEQAIAPGVRTAPLATLTTRDWLAAHEPELLAALVGALDSLEYVQECNVPGWGVRAERIAAIKRLITPPAPFHLPPRQFQEMHNAG